MTLSQPCFWSIFATHVLICFSLTAYEAQAAKATAASAPLSVSISIPAQGAFAATNETRQLSFRVPSEHFHVLISNVSTNEVRLWKEDCSWGYEALSFHITDSAGNQWPAKKKPRAWRSNFPRWWLLKPDETLIIDVNFSDGGVWEGFKRPPKNSSLKLTLVAAFEIQPDERGEEYRIWNGRVVSKPVEAAFYD